MIFQILSIVLVSHALRHRFVLLAFLSCFEMKAPVARSKSWISTSKSGKTNRKWRKQNSEYEPSLSIHIGSEWYRGVSFRVEFWTDLKLVTELHRRLKQVYLQNQVENIMFQNGNYNLYNTIFIRKIGGADIDS